MGIESVVAADQVPSGTRSAELWGKLIDVVQSWRSSGGVRSVRLEIDGDTLEVMRITRGDQRELVWTWIDRHADG